jgi:hypothetical protein
MNFLDSSELPFQDGMLEKGWERHIEERQRS